MGKLDGKVAVVTGGAMGMGYGSAKVMARHGAKVVLIDNSETVTAAAKTYVRMLIYHWHTEST